MIGIIGLCPVWHLLLPDTTNVLLPHEQKEAQVRTKVTH